MVTRDMLSIAIEQVLLFSSSFTCRKPASIPRNHHRRAQGTSAIFVHQLLTTIMWCLHFLSIFQEVLHRVKAKPKVKVIYAYKWFPTYFQHEFAFALSSSQTTRWQVIHFQVEAMKCLLKVPNLQTFHFWGSGWVKLHFPIWSPTWHEHSKSANLSFFGGGGKVALWNLKSSLTWKSQICKLFISRVGDKVALFGTHFSYRVLHNKFLSGWMWISLSLSLGVNRI